MSSKNRARKSVRMSRALGIALTPKAERYMQRRPYRPGEHGRGRVKDSDYSIRLKEKQRLRAQYGIREAQLRKIWNEARKMEGMSGENLMALLESRLDALVLRAGFARTIAQARQIVVHGHILVDGKHVDRPSFRVKPGQVVQVKPKSQTSPMFLAAAQGQHADVLPAAPEYIKVDLEKLRFEFVRLPLRPEIPVTCEIQMVVEHYSR
ncbi:30S ribosomal protein S4 [Arcanobacterium canis]|uniref:Small ribosomal subunit protein uS4 n=1 Tax=Arcanobacterium canis TaxID=999183 RepID=A0ABY8FVW4_9ACTO|nr:30S ribosomal protein S4 [Arcanobacterium canis]WFM82654.1 30S ribosomal protein S4 [Arcanobacterium canis]